MKGFGAIVLLSPLLLVPTIADIEQARGEPRLAIIERLYYALIGQKRVFYSVFSSRFVHENMVLSARNAEAGRYWTYLTYAFIHKDMEHLVSNLAPIISSGATISTIYGDCVVFVTFLGGVLAGGLNIYQIKEREQAKGITSRYEFRVIEHDSLFIKHAKTFWNSAVDRLADHAAPILYKKMNYIGASTGASSLLAFEACICMEEILFPKGRAKTVAAFALPSLISALAFVYTEWNEFHSVGASDGVGHSAHLLGFSFGVFAFVMLKVKQKLL